MEGVLVVATLARKWRLRLVPEQRVEPQPGVTLRPRHGIRMTPERREVSFNLSAEEKV
jgi:cytochrome P450